MAEVARDAQQRVVTRRALLDHVAGTADAAVLVVDLDGFALVNELRGTDAADHLLAQLVEAITALVGEDGRVASLGADRLAVSLDRSRAAALAADAHRAVPHPITIGAADSVVGNATRPVHLLRAAEQALRAGKAAGGQRTAWASKADDQDGAALLRAVRSGEFSVAYQPIVSIETGMVAALEALVRWEDPDRGVLLPERFLDRADELGLLAPIGMQLAGMAIDRLGEWQHEMGRPDLALHLNMSVSQLARPSLTGVIAGQLRRAGVRASSLVAEIPEAALVHGGEVAHQSAALRSMGVRVALDRFGSGSLCMADLRRRPLDLVKIELDVDRALGGMFQERTLVAVIRDVAEALGVDVVATGVEHDRQLLPAVGMGCDLAQGLLFAGPVGELDVPEVLQRPRFWWRTVPPSGTGRRD